MSVHKTQIASPFDPPQEGEGRAPLYPVGGGPPSGAHPAIGVGGHPVGGGPPSGAHQAVTPGSDVFASPPRRRSGLGPSSGRQPVVGGGPPSGMGPIGGGPPSGVGNDVAPATGGYPAVRQGRHAPSTGGYPAVSPPSHGESQGGYPIDRHTHETAIGRPSGIGRVERPSDQGPVSGVGPSPSGQGPVSGVGKEPPPQSRSALPRVGEVFHGYQVVELLGQGNMGRIYRVRDQLGRDLALKVILGQVASAEGLARFEREGQAMAAIPRHKHVIGVHSAGTTGGLPFLVLDFVEGENLDEVLRRGPLPAAQAALVVEKLSRALDHVHQSGVLHRDLKPANVLIRAIDGEPLLTDFGLAGMQGANSLTRTGDVIGTPLYMAPEQLLGLHREVDGRADVWSLGVMLYEMASGTLPFPGSTMLEVTDAVLGADPPKLHERSDGDPALTRIVNLALEKDKQDRLPSPGALAAALRAWRKQRQGHDIEIELPEPKAKPLDRRLLIAAAGVALLLLLVVVGGLAAVRGKGAGDPVASGSPGEDDATRPPATPGVVTPEAAAALDALEDPRFNNRPRELEAALENPHLENLPASARYKVRLVGLSALTEINLELVKRTPQPGRIAAFLRAAGHAQRLSQIKIPGHVNVDEILKWILSREQGEVRPLDDPNWIEVFRAIRASGFRPTQRMGGKFLDELSFDPSRRQRGDYPQILSALVAVGVPAFYHQFDLRTRPKPPTNGEDPIALYIYYRAEICYQRNRDDTARERARVKLGQLVREQPEAFDPRTVAQGLNLTVLPGEEHLDAEIARFEAALEAAPDSFFGWEGLIVLYLQKAEQAARRKDRAGVEEAFELANKVARRGRDVFHVEDDRPRPTTEAQAMVSLLRRELELHCSQGKKQWSFVDKIEPRKREDAKKQGLARYERIRANLGD